VSGSPPGDGTLDLFSAAEEDRSAPVPRVWTVSELNGVLRAFLEDAFGELTVTGEVANWTRARSGHCYFTLKDESAQIRCVIWRRDAARLPVDPEEGMALRVRGRVTMYETRGELQLQVRELEADGGDGLWKLAFERLKGTLEREGLLDPARKRPLPRFPRTVGIVTSPTGAAIRDILTVIRRRAPWTRVLVRAARVQGEGAAEEIARALAVLAASGRVDMIIVGRGGGSIEDLWAFNEEPVARAVAASPVPVISAVGHETDVTISDLVADLRAPTPSAAAEAAVRDRAALAEALDRVRPRLARCLRAQAERRRLRLDEGARRATAGVRRTVELRRGALERISHRTVPAAKALLAPRWTRVDRVGERLERAVRHGIGERRGRLAQAAARVEALSPLSTLRRGYAVPLSPEGTVLRRAQDFGTHPRFHLRVVDGRIECETLGIEDGHT
jgi:exodeoxyribonuclease VII large subunit